MKFLSQLFADRDTDWTSKAFAKARLKLVLLYVSIIAAVIGLFAILVVLQVTEKIDSQQLPPNSQIVVSTKDARLEAQKLIPTADIESTKYSLEDNTLLYKVTFSDDSEAEVDLLTGEARIGDEKESGTSLIELLTDNIIKVIWWIGAGVFLIASFGSLLIAQATLRPIKDSLIKQKRFVSDASHELRNPLAAIKTTLESYTREKNRDKQFNDEVAHDLLVEVERLIGTSESLLTLESHEKRRRTVTNVAVHAVIDVVRSRLKENLEEKHITITSKVGDASLHIDQHDLETIIYNLVHNAIKFSPADTEIVISSSKNQLIVKDQGHGIESKHLPYIFERFYKADDARSFDTSSNGLGLALVAEIVHSYGGTISVESEVGKGTAFTMKFS